jgi:hypothetical protein
VSVAAIGIVHGYTTTHSVTAPSYSFGAPIPTESGAVSSSSSVSASATTNPRRLPDLLYSHSDCSGSGSPPPGSGTPSANNSTGSGAAAAAQGELWQDLNASASALVSLPLPSLSAVNLGGRLCSPSPFPNCLLDQAKVLQETGWSKIQACECASKGGSQTQWP